MSLFIKIWIGLSVFASAQAMEGETIVNNTKKEEVSYELKLTKQEIENKLGKDSLAFKVMRKDATEPPHKNEFWDSKEEGIYVDVLTGEPLFSSTQKFDSGTGWPSFWDVIEPKFVVKKKDFKSIWPRTEVRSKNGDNHLGHVFDDGPKPTNLRYCINSAALRFVPKEKMQELGYSAYLYLFEAKK